MPKKININDPEAWQDLNWDEEPALPALKKTDAQIAMGRPSRNRKETGEAKKNAKKAAKTRFSKESEKKKQSEIGRRIMTTSENFLKKKEEAREESKRPVVTPFGEFNSYNDAQRNIPVDLAKKLKGLPHLYYYKNDGPGEVVYEDVYVSPYGSSNKRADVYGFCKNKKEPNAVKLSHKANWWKKMSMTFPNEYYIETRPAHEWSIDGILRNKTDKNLKRSNSKPTVSNTNMNRVNINDADAWKDLDWDDPVSPDILKRSDATVARSRSALRKRNDPNFRATMSEAATKRNQDPIKVANQLHGVRHHRDNSYQAEVNSRPEVKEKLRKSQAGKPKSESHKASLKATTTNKPGDPNWEAAHKAGLAKRDKPFHAGEYGIFQSRSEAAKYATGQGLKNALKKFEAWSKSNPEEYYFIKEQ